MNLTPNALQVLKSRYLMKNKADKVIETPGQLFYRVAASIAAAEKKFGNGAQEEYWKNKFYEALTTLAFLPNSPTLMNAGTTLGQLSACYVLPVADSMESIFTTLKHAALIQQSGGGTGFNFSALRPANDFIASTGGTSSGPVSFMKIFDAATENIKQGGKRRGANMGILDCTHPDLESFISCKSDGGLTNFNISVSVTNAFMETVMRAGDWTLIHPHDNQKSKIVKASDIWKQITDCAWRTGDPGLIFYDAIAAKNPTPVLGDITATNPCGEVPLLPYESCNLGSVDVAKCVAGKDMDWKKLEELIHVSVRFLDNVIEVNRYPIPETEAMAKGNRKIGLGVMGWADTLIKLNIPYASETAIALAKQLMHFVSEKSHEASVALAKERGCFPNWEKSIYFPHTPIRNATRTSIAPTGTISIIAGTSFSIEPLFALAFRREKVLQQETLTEVNALFMSYLKESGINASAIISQVEQTGIASGIEALPEHARQLFQTSMEISYEWHLRHQLAFQEFTDNAVSKTINMANTATREDVANAYMQAWRSGAKGITIYRDGSKGKQVLVKGIGEQKDFASCKVCV